MEWSPNSAQNAYLDTLKLCSKHEEQCESSQTAEPESREFISALAAGMNAKRIVEVTAEASPSTIALAAAARQTGGKLVCIVPEPSLDESQKVIDDTGLNEMVEFKTGDPVEILPSCENIDFFLVDCKADNYTDLLELVDVNPRRSVVVADNLVEGRRGLGGHMKGIENEGTVRSTKHPIGKGMEVTMIEGSDVEPLKWQHHHHHHPPSRAAHARPNKAASRNNRTRKSRWVKKVDENSGEEHIYRMPESQ
ncbi:uncharacterized protein LOC127787672 [Diospyros lotus]|uniref:uncharacterized protein LOC127787672 n=1 Tax=Diospyros lotus TaxID=55363 RepID=UPI00225800CF|nr:uncharacterized protein LOC127787672 [Diospyros lotus]